MSAAVMVHRPGSPPEPVTLAGPASAGGGPADAVRIDGAPPGALALTPSPTGVVVEARVPGALLHRGSAPPRALPPGRRRLLGPGDRLRLAGATLASPDEAPAGTRVLAGRLVAEAARGDEPVTGPHLLALEGPDAGLRLPVRQEATLGRGGAATLRLTDGAASRRHARLARTGDDFTVEDLGRTNGLRLNGRALRGGPAALHPGDEISLGRGLLTLVLPVEEASAPGTSAGPEADGMAPAEGPDPGRARPHPAIVGAAAFLAGAVALAAIALRG